MTTFNIVISERIDLLGLAPSTKWLSGNWGTIIWSEGTDALQIVTKALPEGISLADAVSKDVLHVVIQPLGVAGDMGSESLLDGNGYYYNFPDRTTDGEERDPTTYTSGTSSVSGWATVAAGSTTWS